jgi:type IV pilus assembly protein PilC
MIYPLVLLILTVAIVAVLLAFVVPTFVGMFKQIGGDLPAPTKILLSISNAITGYWYLLLLGIGFIVLVVYIAFKSPKVRIAFDKFKLRMPVFGKLQIIVESAQFARTLASLFSSGLPIIQALDIVGKVIGNRFIKEKLFDVTEDVKKGLSLSIAMRKIALFPLMLCSMLSIGEESGNMDEILNKTAEFYDEESDTSIQRMVALIEPLMIVLMGAMVGFIVISIIMPVFSMYNQINSTGGA